MTRSLALVLALLAVANRAPSAWHELGQAGDAGAATIVQRIASQVGGGVYVDGPGVFTRHRVALSNDGRLELSADLCNAGQSADATFAARCARGDMTQSVSSVSIDLAGIDSTRTRSKSVRRLVSDGAAPRLVAATALVYSCKANAACVTGRTGSRYAQFDVYCDDAAACQRLKADIDMLAGPPAGLPPPTAPSRTDRGSPPIRPADPGPLDKINELVRHINAIAASAHHSAVSFDKGDVEKARAHMDITQHVTFDAAAATLQIHKVVAYQTVAGARRLSGSTLTATATVPLREASVIRNLKQSLQGGDAPAEPYRAVGLQCFDKRKCVSWRTEVSQPGTLTSEPFISTTSIDCEPSACDAVADDVVQIVTIVRRSKL